MKLMNYRERDEAITEVNACQAARGHLKDLWKKKWERGGSTLTPLEEKMAWKHRTKEPPSSEPWETLRRFIKTVPRWKIARQKALAPSIETIAQQLLHMRLEPEDAHLTMEEAIKSRRII